MPVYMIQAGETGPVKIGCAGMPERRLRSLQNMNCMRLRIIRLFEGGKAEEERLHHIFAPFRMHGEWFEFSPIMLKEDFGLRPYREPAEGEDGDEPEDGGLDESDEWPARPQKATVRFGPDKQGVLLGVLPQGKGKKWRPRRSGFIRTKEYRRFAKQYQLEQAAQVDAESPPETGATDASTATETCGSA